MSRGRRRWLRRGCIGVLLLGLGLAAWAFLIEPGLLRVRETRLVVPGLADGHEGLRVAVLTDLHVGAPHVDVAQLRRVVDETNSARPDLVLILGDLVIHGVRGGTFVEPEVIAEELGRLDAGHGVLAVLGNHDWWLDGPRVTAALEGAGLRVLENEAVRVDHEGAGLWLGGIADAMTRVPDIGNTLAQVRDDEPVILFTHNPDVFPDVPPRVSLTLAGHTHGGQVCVPLLGPPVVPSRFGQRYAAGLVVEDERHLFVSTGVGTSILPVRFLVAPVIDILVLDPA